MARSAVFISMIAAQYGLVAQKSTRCRNLPWGLPGGCCRSSTLEGKVGRQAKLLTAARRGDRGEYRQAAGAIAPDVGHPPLDVLCSLWDAIDSARLAKRFDEPLYRPKRITARNLLLQTLAKLGGADCRG